MKFINIYKSKNISKINVKMVEALNDAYLTAFVQSGDAHFVYCFTMFFLFYFV